MVRRAAVALGQGKLGALVEMRDTTLAGYRTQLDTLAKGIADAVNAVHATGVDASGNAGLAFFTYTAGSEATSLAVNAGDRCRPAARGGRRRGQPAGRREHRRADRRPPFGAPVRGRHPDRVGRLRGPRLGDRQQQPPGLRDGRQPGARRRPPEDPARIDQRRLARRGGDRHDPLPARLPGGGPGDHRGRRDARQLINRTGLVGR